MKIGLVLEGGGMRGLFSAGVLDALLELKELSVNGIVAVSSGALFGVNYVSKQKKEQLDTIRNMQMIKDIWVYIVG